RCCAAKLPNQSSLFSRYYSVRRTIQRLQRAERAAVLRTYPFVVTVLLVTTLVLMRPLAQASLDTQRSLPDTTENIHVGFIFDYQEPDLSLLKDQVDYVWGGSPKTKGPSLPYVDYYIPFSRDGNSSHS